MGARQFRQDPPVDRQRRCLGIKPSLLTARVHLGKAGRIPQLGSEVAVACYPAPVELHVAPLSRHDRQREAQCVGAVFVYELQRSMTLPLDFDIFCPFLSTDERMNIHRVERLDGVPSASFMK